MVVPLGNIIKAGVVSQELDKLFLCVDVLSYQHSALALLFLLLLHMQGTLLCSVNSSDPMEHISEARKQTNKQTRLSSWKEGNWVSIRGLDCYIKWDKTIHFGAAVGTDAPCSWTVL